MGDRARQNNSSDWWRPKYNLGFPQAIELTTSIAAPLLAGFSIALIGVVAQASEHFRFPGTCVLFLAFAAVMLLVCVQCGFWARQYLTTPSETKNWYDDIDYVTQADAIKSKQRGNAAGYQAWISRARWSYQFALLSLLLGVAVLLMPGFNPSGPHAPGSEQPILRWAASGILFAMVIFELFWVFGLSLERVTWLKERKIVKWAVLTWFYPVAAREQRTRRKERIPKDRQRAVRMEN